MNLSRTTVLFALLAGCSASQGTAASTQGSASADPTPTPSGGVMIESAVLPDRLPANATRDVCGTLTAESNAVVSQATRNARLFEIQRDQFQPFGRCFRTPGGAWAIVLESVDERSFDMGAVQRFEGRWSLTHTDGSGEHRVQRRPALPSEGRDRSDDPVNFVAGHPTKLHVGEPTFFDYDGDHEPEVAIVLTETTHEYGTTRRGRIWSFRNGEIDLYPHARDHVITEIRDRDGDGRPDLATAGPFVGEWTDRCNQHTATLAGPAMWVHSLPNGRFSSDDETAVNATREACPERPSTIVALQDGGAVDFARTAQNVACARLWGQGTAQVANALASGCRRAARSLRRGQCVPACNEVMLQRWARAQVPLRLR